MPCLTSRPQEKRERRDLKLAGPQGEESLCTLLLMITPWSARPSAISRSRPTTTGAPGNLFRVNTAAHRSDGCVYSAGGITHTHTDTDTDTQTHNLSMIKVDNGLTHTHSKGKQTTSKYGADATMTTTATSKVSRKQTSRVPCGERSVARNNEESQK